MPKLNPDSRSYGRGARLWQCVPLANLGCGADAGAESAITGLPLLAIRYARQSEETEALQLTGVRDSLLETPVDAGILRCVPVCLKRMINLSPG